MEINYRLLGPSDVLFSLDQITRVYREAFAVPPYSKEETEVVEFSKFLPTHITQDGFRFLAALEKNQSQVIGFAYGRRICRGGSWYDTVTANLDEDLRSEWLDDAFQLVELAVTPAFQKTGIGGTLHDRMLGGLPYKRALLTTVETRSPALGLYKRRGWELIKASIAVAGLPRRYRLMGLRLE